MKSFTANQLTTIVIGGMIGVAALVSIGLARGTGAVFSILFYPAASYFTIKYGYRGYRWLAPVVARQYKDHQQKKERKIAEAAQLEEEAFAGGIRHFMTKVAGVSYKNPDGSRRQDVADGCKTGELLEMRPEPDNPHDPNAIGIYDVTGSQLGFFGAHLCEEVHDNLQRGYNYQALVSEVTGRDMDTLGVNLCIVVARPDVRIEAMKPYIKKLLLNRFILEP
jgi:hypothetical protein